jgi:Sulfatase
MGNLATSDLLLVVLDCVSSRDFCGGEDPVPGLRASQDLAHEGLLYTRAVSPASWTPPSHASMFTGSNPWDSGACGPVQGGRYRNGATLAQKLGAMGYQTASFSANPYISPETGLSRGFDVSRWGSFSDCGLRKLTAWISSPHTHPSRSGAPPLIDKLSRSSRGGIAAAISDLPVVTDIATRLIAGALGGGPGSPSRVAPWIEPSVEDWLKSAAENKPVFCFVNLLDAHEPFVGLPERVTDLADWFRPLLARQRERTRDGQPVVTDTRDGELVRSLYRQAITILDERLSHLFAAFQRNRDWDETCVVVTSDHGQAMGESNLLFHTKGTADSVHRVPLIVKPAQGRSESARVDSWTTLTNLPSIIAASSFGLESLDGSVSALSGVTGTKGSLSFVLSLADNLDPEIPVNRKSGTDGYGGRSAIVGYSDEHKLVVDTATLRSIVFRVDESGRVSPELLDPADENLSNLKEAAMEAAIKMQTSVRIQGSSLPKNFNDSLRRLAGWGYE